MEQVEKIIGYTFSDKALLKKALTHTSFVNENGGRSYERLEFLGDALVDFIVGEHFFENFPNYPEGTLTELRKMAVCEEELCRATCMQKLSTMILHGKGTVVNDKIKADVFEALSASIYLDGGMSEARKFVIRNIDLVPESLKERHEDYKSIITEIVRKNKKTISFEVLKTSGPDHEKVYEVAVIVDKVVLATASAIGKKRAEQLSSKLALQSLSLKK